MSLPPSITLWLGDQPHRVAAGRSLAALLDELALPALAVSAAVNGCFVPRSQHADVVLRDGDRVVLFEPITGG